MAQTPREEILRDPNIAGANYQAYPGPSKALTPAPGNKRPCYISHYARHGSRYLDSRQGYYIPLDILQQADSMHCLKEYGYDVLRRIETICAESDNRIGDLTLLGAQQHQGIAQRMYERFPEVFVDSAEIDAKSTVVRRSMLSMMHEVLALTQLNPTLQVSLDASEHDMYYMNLTDEHLIDIYTNDTIDEYLATWDAEHIHPYSLFDRLFTHEFAAQIEEPIELYSRFFSLATILQNSDIGRTISLYDLFTDEEIYNLWLRSNLWWFCAYGFNVLNGATQPFSQRNLLRQIISQADVCLAKDIPGATLRFGHDTMVLPLACLLDLNGYGFHGLPDEALDHGWVNYRIFPMACNIQFIFYREAVDDEDVWVKILLNEDEATLPIPSADGPYYRWSDVKDYCNTILDSYHEE